MRPGLSMAPLGLALFASTAFATQSWPTYVNARFGYGICYPAAMLKPQPEADNGDGRIFTGANGAKLAIWGSYRMPDQTIRKEHDDRLRYLRVDHVSISYDRRGADWFALSGTVGKEIVYLKAKLVRDRWLMLEMRYPAMAAKVWNPMIGRIAACLVPQAGQAR